MTNTTGGAAAPGWYPVAPGSTQLRWWDGAKWTEHLHDQVAVGTPAGQVPKAPAGTNPNTVWIWILAVLPLLSLLSIAFFNFKQYIGAIESIQSGNNTDPTAAFEAIAGSGYAAIFGVAFLVYVLGIVFAALDFRALKAVGVVKPFHWAFSFIPSSYGYLVYMIGRFVIVKRRTGRGLAPLWLWIAVYVVVVIVSIVIVYSQLGSIITENLSNS